VTAAGWPRQRSELDRRSNYVFVTYLRRELRRRIRQATFIALGLAVGIGLVITVTAASSGVKSAQATVLQNLYGVGTAATVTTSPSAGSFTPGGRNFAFKPGATVKVDSLTATRSLGSLDDSAVTTISKLDGVAAAAGALTANSVDSTFKIPDFSSGTGGSGTGGSGTGGSGTGGSGTGGSGTGGSDAGGRSTGSGGFSGPGSFSTGDQVTVDGVDLASGAEALGPLSNGTLSAGRTLKSPDADADVAVVDSGYAKSASLKVGSDVTLANTKLTVVGIVTDPADDSSADVYIPLARAQALSSTTGKVNTIYVAADNSSDIGAVQKEITKAVPGATVTTSADLATEVTGSLSSASSLANNLGKWLAIAVLIAAFLLASLLTMSAVSRRVREFGTLKALGWRSRRVIGQVMGESITIGAVGGAAGIALGFAGAAVVSAVAPSLTAYPGQTTGSATPGGARSFFGSAPGGAGGSTAPGGGGGFARAAADTSHAVAVHLTASVTVDAVVLAVVLALAGGLIAGTFGGWRAARLRPAAALSRVE
jgi:ABC-type lipoprotein release transport system permease subunit